MHYLVLLIQLTVILFLFNQRSSKNKFHLDFFIAHLFCLILIVLIYLPIKLLGYQVTNSYFYASGVFVVLSVLFIVLNIETLLKGYSVSIRKYIYFIAVSLFISCLVLIPENYILNYHSKQTVFYDIKIPDLLVFSELFFLQQIFKLILMGYLYYTFKSNIDKSQNIKDKKTFSLWVYSFIGLFTISLCLSSIFFYDLLNLSDNLVLRDIINAIVVLNLIYFILFPSIIFCIPEIRIKLFKNRSDQHFDFMILQSYFENEKVYLNPKLTIAKVSEGVHTTENIVRDSVKISRNLNFNDFVNEYRVNHSVKLMISGHLNNHDMISLAKKSGFNSPQTFYRSFAKFYSISPSKYYKSNIVSN
jgi:AraC-like DNA-binding protein